MRFKVGDKARVVFEDQDDTFGIEYRYNNKIITITNVFPELEGQYGGRVEGGTLYYYFRDRDLRSLENKTLSEVMF